MAFLDIMKIGCLIKGDRFYDYAKILQSLSGYDEILLSKTVDTKYSKGLLETFKKIIINKFGEKRWEEICQICVSHLFSLIPLHTDLDKCKKYYGLIEKVYSFF